MIRRASFVLLMWPVLGVACTSTVETVQMDPTPGEPQTKPTPAKPRCPRATAPRADEATKARPRGEGASVADPYQWMEAASVPERDTWVKEQMAHTKCVLDAEGSAAWAESVKSFYLDWQTGLVDIVEDHGSFLGHWIDSTKSALVSFDTVKSSPRTLIENVRCAGTICSIVDFSASPSGKYVAITVKAYTSTVVGEVVVIDRATGNRIGAAIPATDIYMGRVQWLGDGGIVYRTVDPNVLSIDDQDDQIAYFGSIETRFRAVPSGADVLLAPRSASFPPMLDVSSDHQRMFRRGLSNSSQISLEIADVVWEGDNPKLEFSSAGDIAGAYPMPEAFTSEGNHLAFIDAPRDADPTVKTVTLEKVGTGYQLSTPRILLTAAEIPSIRYVGTRLVARHTERATTQIAIFDEDAAKPKIVRAANEGSAKIGFGENADFAILGSTSFASAFTVERVNLASGERTELSEFSAKPNERFAPRVERIEVRSKDGTMVPVVLVLPEGHKRDGKTPTYLYGYGGFGVNIEPTPTRLLESTPWVAHGGIYALAQIRGGAERGSKWHTAAMKEKKQNTFDDFIAIAEYLERERYTSAAHLAIAGASNGGLLVASVAQQRPELFHAAISLAPVADMLRYELMGRDAGVDWVQEYGSASAGGTLFNVLSSYSPYHQALRATARSYPKFFLGVGDHDTRVNPGHSYKLFAALERAATPESEMVLRIGVGGNHGVASSSEERFLLNGEALNFASTFDAPPAPSPKASGFSPQGPGAMRMMSDLRMRQVAEALAMRATTEGDRFVDLRARVARAQLERQLR